MLRIENLTVRIAGRTLIEGATLSLSSGHKAGLIGRNGTGKSTLFHVIDGDMAPDAGSVEVSHKWRIGRVAQEAPDGPESLLETVLMADAELSALYRESETATDPNRIGAIHERLADIDAHTAESRAASILAGLGFDKEAQAKPCQSFSGGWRMRVALAGALFARPDFLMLDEPSNHLDLEAVLWLESYLAAWRGTLLVISHERDLLNAVCDEIVHLEGGKLTRYAGNYDRFERTRSERMSAESRMRERQQEEREHIQSFIDRFRAKATKARQAQSRIKQLARMQPIASVVAEPSIAFSLPSPESLPPPLIVLDRIDAGYEPGKPVLSGLDLRIDMDDRIALIGANGNGKSTFVRLLAGRLEPLAGRITAAKKLRVGYFAQHQAEELTPDQSAFNHMSKRLPNAAPPVVRAQLGRFGFSQGKADTPSANLSGGEKARLLFALMTADKPHILLLDEPTNHLDVDARESLVHALNDYQGAVILVSHDAHLIDLVADRLWLVADGNCKPFDGDLDDYRRSLLQARRGKRREKTNRSNKNNSSDKNKGGDKNGITSTNSETGNELKPAKRRDRATARSEVVPLRRAANIADESLQRMTRKRAEMQKKLAEPGFYDRPSSDIAGVQRDLAELERSMQDAEAEWLQAHETLEAAQRDAAE